MRVLARMLLILASLSLIAPIHAADSILEIRATEGKSPVVAELIPREVDMGSIAPDGKSERTIELKNSLPTEIKLDRMRSPCTCLEIRGAPESIKPNAVATLTVVLGNASSFRGTFTKHLHIRFTSGKDEADAFIPIKFTVLSPEDDGGSKATPPAAPSFGETSPFFEIVEHKGSGGFEAYSGSKVVAWVFASRGCPGCRPLFQEILPKLFKAEDNGSRPRIGFISLDEQSGMVLLANEEERLHARGEKTPVLLCQGKLYYGNEAIKALIKE